jgi:hypothetical protein
MRSNGVDSDAFEHTRPNSVTRTGVSYQCHGTTT